jgi:hypothetical protein
VVAGQGRDEGPDREGGGQGHQPAQPDALRQDPATHARGHGLGEEFGVADVEHAESQPEGGGAGQQRQRCDCGREPRGHGEDQGEQAGEQDAHPSHQVLAQGEAGHQRRCGQLGDHQPRLEQRHQQGHQDIGHAQMLADPRQHQARVAELHRHQQTAATQDVQPVVLTAGLAAAARSA